MHERYEFNACSMHDKMQYSCMILAKIHCMIMHDLIPWGSSQLPCQGQILDFRKGGGGGHIYEYWCDVHFMPIQPVFGGGGCCPL